MCVHMCEGGQGIILRRKYKTNNDYKKVYYILQYFKSKQCKI